MPLLKHHKINIRLLVVFIAIIAALITIRSFFDESDQQEITDFPQIKKRGVLRALTLYSSASYFIYREREMGYEYELCKRLAESMGLELKMITVNNIHALVDSLHAGAGDIVAFNVPVSMYDKENFIPCGREFLTHQVLVQDVGNKSGILDDVTQLSGKEIVVQKNTRFHKRLENLNNEIGGGIIIKAIDEDSITTEEIISKVASGEYNYTIADNVNANLNKTYYRNINVNLRISFPQHSFWLVRSESVMLARMVNSWFRNNVKSKDYEAINKRYFELSKGSSSFHMTGLFIGKDGRLSPYDNVFKKYGKSHGWDWRLLASIAYQESNFLPNVVSWSGAKGLMQIMPKTAKDYGINPDSLFYPESNVHAAVKLLNDLTKKLGTQKTNQQHLKIILAGYNSGLGHIFDARALTKKYGKNPYLWDDNVGKYVLLKSQSKYYEDEVCKQGYLRGEETASFVAEVWTRYQYYVKRGVEL